MNPNLLLSVRVPGSETDTGGGDTVVRRAAAKAASEAAASARICPAVVRTLFLVPLGPGRRGRALGHDDKNLSLLPAEASDFVRGLT